MLQNDVFDRPPYLLRGILHLIHFTKLYNGVFKESPLQLDKSRRVFRKGWKNGDFHFTEDGFHIHQHEVNIISHTRKALV